MVVVPVQFPPTPNGTARFQYSVFVGDGVVTLPRGMSIFVSIGVAVIATVLASP